MFKFIITGFFALLSLNSYSHTLDTPDFTITITCQQKEYEVGCDSAIYEGISKKTGNKINLQGKQLMKLCADGVTPCHSLGYEFYNGNIRYLVTDDGELIVSQGDEILLQQAGHWSDEQQSQ